MENKKIFTDYLFSLKQTYQVDLNIDIEYKLLNQSDIFHILHNVDFEKISRFQRKYLQYKKKYLDFKKKN